MIKNVNTENQQSKHRIWWEKKYSDFNMKYTNFMLYQYRYGVPLKQTCKIRLLNMYWCIQSKCYKKLSIRVSH